MICLKLEIVTVETEELINKPGNMTSSEKASRNCNRYSGLREK
jgi:hypothetical protein